MNTLPSWRSESANNKETVSPYVYEYYNVMFYSQRRSSATKHVISRIVNSIVEGLNRRPRLPRFLVIMLDKDLIEDVDLYDFGAPAEYRRNLNWLFRQISMLIRRRRLDLIDKKPGAVYNTDPKVIFVKMIKRVAFYNKGHRMEKVCSMRTKFNNLIDEEVAAFDYHVINILACSTEDCFDPQGKLTPKGKRRYWQQLDELIEKFDKKKIALVPQSYGEQNHMRDQERGRERERDQGHHRERDNPRRSRGYDDYKDDQHSKAGKHHSHR